MTSLIASSSKLYVKLDNGTYVLNDFSSAPGMTGMSQCPANQSDSNVTQSTSHKCMISQAHTSTASSTSSSISILLLLLHVALLTSNNFLHRNLVECTNVVVALLLSSVAVVVWNFETLKALLILVTTSAIATTTYTSFIIITGS